MDYFIKVNLALALFYCFYQLVLRRSVYFTANRAFLLSGLGLAFIIPAIQLSLGSLSGIPTSALSTDALLRIASSPWQNEPAPILLDTVSVVAGEQARAALTPGEWAVILYCSISFLFLLRILFLLYELRRLYRKNPVTICDGYSLVRLEHQEQSAFSFFSIVFINTADLRQKDNWILRHELVHVKHLHSLDILLSEIVKALLWINPFAHLYQRALRSVNEYTADAIVPPEDKNSYAKLMYDYTFRSGGLALPNSFFNKTLLKRRIDMLYQQKTPKMKAAYLLVVPLLAALLAFTSRDASQADLTSTLSAQQQSKPGQSQYDQRQSAESRAVGTQTSATKITRTPIVSEYRGEAITVTGTVTDAAGKAMAGVSIFVLETPHGTATDREGHFELRDIPSHAELQFSMIGYETERVQLQNNHTVNIRLQRKQERLEEMIVVSYVEKHEKSLKQVETATSSTPQNDEKKVYSFTSIEKMPQFPGGENELISYVAKHFRYPTKARDNKVEGLIEIGFIVDEKGNVTDSEILKGVGSGCDEEALRVINDFPRWEPGEQNGAKVAVYYILPINLRVNQPGE